MLLQSHNGEIHLLPALPSAWPDGSVKGLCARGGIVVDIEWHDGALSKTRLKAKYGGEVRLRYGEKTVTRMVKPAGEIVLEGEFGEA